MIMLIYVFMNFSHLFYLFIYCFLINIWDRIIESFQHWFMNKSFGLIKFVHRIVSWVRCLIDPASNVIFVFYEKHIFEMTPTYISLVSFSLKSTHRTQNVLNWLFYTGLLVKKTYQYSNQP